MINIFRKKSFYLEQVSKFCLIFIVTIVLIINGANVAYGQFSLPAGDTPSSSLPKGVQRYGSIEVMMVNSPIDGSELFEIASSAVLNRTNLTEDKLPVEIRGQQINANLQRVLYGKFEDIEGLEISIATLNNQPIIQVSDENITRPIRLITVTEFDADFHGKNPEELALEWKEILEQEFIKSKNLKEGISQRAQSKKYDQSRPSLERDN